MIRSKLVPMEEDQFILRLPPSLVERVRFALSSNRRKDAAGDDKKSSNFRLDFTDERNATFFVDNVAYPASLVDLPALAETHKTADKRTFYKSGDVHQMLIVRMPDEPPPDFTILPDGLSPAAQSAGKRLAEPPKTFPPDMIESIEQRIKYVIDHKVKFKPKKDTPAPPTVEEEVVIEEETLPVPVVPAPSGATPAAPAPVPSANSTEEVAPVDTQSQAPAPAPQAPTPQPPAAQLPPLPPTQPPTPAFAATPIDAALLAPVAPSPMPDAPTPADGLMSPSIAGPDTPAFVDTPAGADTPLPDGDGDDDDDNGDGEDDDDDDDDDDEDDDDFAELAGELLKDEEEEARKRIERSNLDVKIAEQKRKVADVQAQAERAPNALLKSRIMSKKMELQGILEELEKNRATLGD